jgi:hypothetical protein
MNTMANVIGDRRWRQSIGGIIGDRVNTDEMGTSRSFLLFVFPSFRARQHLAPIFRAKNIQFSRFLQGTKLDMIKR